MLLHRASTDIGVADVAEMIGLRALVDARILDLDKIPDPLAPENLLKTSGRGIFLIRSFMDQVEIHPTQTGTEIKLIKHVHGSAAGAKEASQ